MELERVDGAMMDEIEGMSEDELANAGAAALTEITQEINQIGQRLLLGKLQPPVLRAYILLMDAVVAAPDDPDDEPMPGELRVARMFARGLDAFFREMEQVEAALGAAKGEQ